MVPSAVAPTRNPGMEVEYQVKLPIGTIGPWPTGVMGVLNINGLIVAVWPSSPSFVIVCLLFMETMAPLITEMTSMTRVSSWFGAI